MVLFPDIVKEWHPTKNKHLTPDSFRPGSNKKVWWKCSFGHEWDAQIVSRTTKGTGCPKCFSKTSSLEIRLFCELKYIFGSVSWQKKIHKKECDIYLDDYLVGIEVDGYPWHNGSDKEIHDRLKNDIFELHGIQLIRVRDSRLKSISENDLIYGRNEREVDIVIRLFSMLLLQKNTFKYNIKQRLNDYIEQRTLKADYEYKEIKAYLPHPAKGTSLGDLSPRAVSLWDDKTNAPLEPSMFYPSSSKKVSWICKHAHSWEARISSVYKGSGCPYCSGNIPTKDNNLKVLYPEIAKEWHKEKNGSISPLNMKITSCKQVWWTCSAGHDFRSSTQSRVKGAACPKCKSLGVRYLEKPTTEWHPTKNSPLTPFDVGARSGKKVWWLCDNGHEWEASINNRTAKKATNCPACWKEK